MTAQHGSGFPQVSRHQASRARRRACAALAVALLLTSLSGCVGEDDDDEDEKEPTPVSGTYVGKVSGTRAFVAIVAAPAAEGQDRRDVTVFVCDARRLCEWLSGSVTGDDFTARSEDRDTGARGKLSEAAAKGTLDLPGEETARYQVSRATAASGQYDLTVSSDGELSGASAAGVALTGESSLPRPGTGTLRLADGSRLRLRISRDPEGSALGLRAGQVRLIVLPGGEIRGAGKSRRVGGRPTSSFFIRSSR